MAVIELLPRLRLLRFPVGQAYLWRDGDDLTLVDAGPAGAGAGIVAWAGSFGRVRRVVLTHFHEDHVGGAQEVAALTGAEVVTQPWRRPSCAVRCRVHRPCTRTGSVRCTRTRCGCSRRAASTGRRG
ncbi:ribonuclease BN (tRNA processing enzyme) [Streptomyces sp. DSM 40167]|nr:ribonuclease BN (tRNA processing enzyme) [Streptomyces sp. DSM 40167]